MIKYKVLKVEEIAEGLLFKVLIPKEELNKIIPTDHVKYCKEKSCRKPFISKISRDNIAFCSNACRQKAYRKNKLPQK